MHKMFNNIAQNIISLGFSDISEFIFKEKEKFYDRLQEVNPSGLYANLTFQNLDEVYSECNFKNWDGYKAQPISFETVNTAKNFLKLLPFGFPSPDIGAEPDGAITFEWYKNSNKVISISINPDGKLYYASINGSKKCHGEDWAMVSISDELLNLISSILK